MSAMFYRNSAMFDRTHAMFDRTHAMFDRTHAMFDRTRDIYRMNAIEVGFKRFRRETRATCLKTEDLSL